MFDKSATETRQMFNNSLGVSYAPFWFCNSLDRLYPAESFNDETEKLKTKQNRMKTLLASQMFWLNIGTLVVD